MTPLDVLSKRMVISLLLHFSLLVVAVWAHNGEPSSTIQTSAESHNTEKAWIPETVSPQAV